LENEAYEFEEFATQRLAQTGFQRFGVDVYPGVGPVTYQADMFTLNIDSGESEMLLSGLDPVARSQAQAACVVARGTPKVSSGECIAQVEILLSQVTKALRNPALRAQYSVAQAIAEIREDVQDELREYCTPYPMLNADRDTDAYGRGVELGLYSIPQASIEACTARSWQFIAAQA
jgi:hypothetical protein